MTDDLPLRDFMHDFHVKAPLPPPDARCPVCHFACRKTQCLWIDIPPLTGLYCPKCYSNWIVKHVPKMEDIPEEEKKETPDA